MNSSPLDNDRNEFLVPALFLGLLSVVAHQLYVVNKGTEQLGDTTETLRGDLEAGIQSVGELNKALADNKVQELTKQLGALTTSIEGTTRRVAELNDLLGQVEQATVPTSGLIQRLTTLTDPKGAAGLPVLSRHVRAAVKQVGELNALNHDLGSVLDEILRLSDNSTGLPALQDRVDGLLDPSKPSLPRLLDASTGLPALQASVDGLLDSKKSSLPKLLDASTGVPALQSKTSALLPPVSDVVVKLDSIDRSLPALARQLEQSSSGAVVQGDVLAELRRSLMGLTATVDRLLGCPGDPRCAP